jgi:iron complex transport system substrate-binding protein
VRRAVSLVPSATDIAVSLGAGDAIVGISADCDQPDSGPPRPVVTRSVIEPSLAASDPGTVDAVVRQLAEGGSPLYELDVDLLCELEPEVLFAQDSCAVCALPSADVVAALAARGLACEVVSLDPVDLAGVLGTFRAVGAALGMAEAGRRLAYETEIRLAGLGTPSMRRVLVLDWVEPLYVAGNWVPELVRRAGGQPLLGRAGSPSHPVTAQQIFAADPDAVVVAPCGLELSAAVDAACRIRALLPGVPLLALDGRVWFSRPGPQLVQGAEALATWLGGGQPAAGIAALEVA